MVYRHHKWLMVVWLYKKSIHEWDAIMIYSIKRSHEWAPYYLQILKESVWPVVWPKAKSVPSNLPSMLVSEFCNSCSNHVTPIRFFNSKSRMLLDLLFLCSIFNPPCYAGGQVSLWLLAVANRLKMASCVPTGYL